MTLTLLMIRHYDYENTQPQTFLADDDMTHYAVNTDDDIDISPLMMTLR